mmetsp:Transcript_38683/g.124008  ORF Transcript_38683/g.124008 Transcript_38683/m.124008 type:complete len:192 (-) Transcript_38683:124-699(-)
MVNNERPSEEMSRSSEDTSSASTPVVARTEVDSMQATVCDVEPGGEAEMTLTATMMSISVVAAEAVTVADVAFLTAAGRWSSELFDCCDDVPICCYVASCYYCAFGHVMRAHFGTSCASETGHVICWDVFNGCFGPYLHALKRHDIRNMYGGIHQKRSDCLVTCLCGCCALCQEARHAKAAKPGATGCLGM